MATASVKAEIDRFLSEPKSEVLCVSGAWGAGKTHLWKERVEEAPVNAAVRRYAYVSLFGVNSLAELKQAIFENSVPIDKKGESPTIETLKGFVRSADGFGRRAIGSAFARGYTGDLGPAFFLTVRNHLVCFDDIERRGEDLRIDDVLGLVSYLKEERGCRCVLLLNKEKIVGGDRTAFDRYLEKVADGFLRLVPTSHELTRIAIKPDTPVKSQIEARCIELGISNIRTIRRCEAFVNRVMPLLDKHHEKTKAQAIQTLTLLCWSVFDPDTAPDLEFIAKKRPASMWNKKEELTEIEVYWNTLLDAYNFTNLDEFDDYLLKGIQDGYYSEKDIERCAIQLDSQYDEAESTEDYRTAWSNFNNSFENDEEAVLGGLVDSFINSIEHRSVLDLSALMKLLKSFDRNSEASELLKAYMDAVAGRPPEFFDMDAHYWVHEGPDEELAAAFAKAFRDGKPKRPLKDVLIKVGARGGWDREDEQDLARAGEDDFYEVFKGTHGSELAAVLSGAFNWARISNPSREMSVMLERVRGALWRLGQESRINAHRVHRLGIKVNEPRPVGEIVDEGKGAIEDKDIET